MSNLLKSKILLGVMIVVTLVIGAAVVAHADNTCTLSKTLKVGMTDAQVVCLQSKLGMTASSTHFGPLTLAAVKAFQANNGLTADGVVGAMTRAALMATPVTPTTPTTPTTPATGALCPNGMTLASNCATAPAVAPVTQALCPNGMTLASNCAAAPTTVATGSTDGSIQGSLSSAVSAGATINVGTTGNLTAIKLQAIQGPTKVSRVDVHFSARPWLYFNSLSLKDSTGTVIATLPITDQTSSTEIGVGTDYLVSFTGLNYTVTPGTIVDLIVSGASLAGTNHVTTTYAIGAAITNIRTVNEIGYSDTISGTYSGAISSSMTGSGANYVTLSASGATAAIYANVSSLSPTSSQLSVSSTSGTTTPGVLLGVFGIESQNTDSTLNTLKVDVSGSATPYATTFTNWQISGNGCTAGGVLSSSTVTFSNLSCALPVNTWENFSVKADIAGASTGTVTLTLTPTASTLATTDSNWNSPTPATVAALATYAQTITSNSVALTGLTFVEGSQITGTVNGGSVAVPIGSNTALTFTLTNNSNNNLYISSTPSSFITAAETTPTGMIAGSLALGTPTIGTFTSVSAVSGDVTGNYILPINQARTFTVNGALYAYASGTALQHGQYPFAVSGISYGTATGTWATPVVSSALPVSVAPIF